MDGKPEENHGKMVVLWDLYVIFMEFYGVLEWGLPSGQTRQAGKSTGNWGFDGRKKITELVFNSYVSHYQKVSKMDHDQTKGLSHSSGPDPPPAGRCSRRICASTRETSDDR